MSEGVRGMERGRGRLASRSARLYILYVYERWSSSSTTKLGESSAESPFIVEALQYMPFLSNNALLDSRAFGIVVVEQREVNKRAPNTRAR